MDGASKVEAKAELDARVRSLLARSDFTGAITETLRTIGPEVLGFIFGVLGNEVDAEEVFSAMSERLWRSLATFEWRCSLRTWTYVIARNEIVRFLRRSRRHRAARVRISELADTIAAVTATLSSPSSARRQKLTLLREELPPADRTLLLLRVDRSLTWDEIALVFLNDPEHCTDERRQKEAARLRKRFQLVKERLARRAREEGLLRK
jgi:RNA polymerase sigma-70 factor (ECF subfamily)